MTFEDEIEEIVGGVVSWVGLTVMVTSEVEVRTESEAERRSV